MHPYEWGIIGVKALDFYRIFDCADCTNIAPAVVAAFVAAQASIAASVPLHLGSDRSHCSLSC
ncbi:hypothetical protein [Microcoleus sp. Pol12A6]|uniref:hypothetical protein n=1 Tax=Microcoleus sp. Pol12A6 TaxID=3055393 RepID=UPI002FD5BF0B